MKDVSCRNNHIHCRTLKENKLKKKELKLLLTLNLIKCSFGTGNYWLLLSNYCCENISVFIQKQPLEVLCKRGVLKNFLNFTGKHLCWSLFLIKLQVWELTKKRCFPVKFAYFLTTPILKNICERLHRCLLLSLWC